MKILLRSFLIHLITIIAVTKILPGFTYTGGIKTLIIGAIGLMIINWLIIPLLKIMFLPLNLLTLGFFTWAVNVVAIYFLTVLVPQLKIIPYFFQGAEINGFIIPQVELNILMVAILASFLVGLISHVLQWLVK
ncbi:phage holin family protein [Candidatus Daviesbacteria bacterium]|nr:phage holin family protein [Candidatus Daviesbacteria bacterium]